MSAPHVPGDGHLAPRILTDGLAGRTVFVAPARAVRPDDAALLSRAGPGAAEGPRSWCPFCVGNEGLTPPDVLRAPADPAVPWHARIVPNRYPVTTLSNVTAEAGAARAARGVHDVVIESARHERTILAIDPPAWLVALVPPAPRQPFETWILPRASQAAFQTARAADVAALADLTRWYVGRLDRLVPGAAYNWWLHDLPFRGHDAAAAGWRWHLEILPRLSPLAGFELGTGCHITTLGPAEAARLLHAA